MPESQLERELPPNPVAKQAIAAVEREAERLETPCGNGVMVWRAWGLGSGRPSVVLLHGGYGSWLHWVRNVLPLSRHYTVFAADMPGLGDSDPPPDRRDPDEVGRIIARGILDVVPDEERFQLVGFSFGSIMGGHAARDLAPRLAGFTLVGASAMGLRRAEAPPLGKFRRDMTAEELRELARRNLGILMVRNPETIDEVALHMQMTNTTRAVMKSRWLSRSDRLAQLLPEAPAPLAGIWGEFDSTAYPWVADREELLRRIDPDLDFRVVPGAGHWVMYEAADAFNATLMEVLDGLWRRSDARRAAGSRV